MSRVSPFYHASSAARIEAALALLSEEALAGAPPAGGSEHDEEGRRGGVATPAGGAPAAGARLGNNAKSPASASENSLLRSVEGRIGDREIVAVDDETGELVRLEKRRGDYRVVRDADAARAERYRLQNAVKKLLPGHRTANCLRKIQPGQTGVGVYKTAEGSTHFGHLQTCGSVWACPVCAAKISERRRVELLSAMQQHRASGGVVLFVTYTFSHSRHDDLKGLLLGLSEAQRAMKGHRTYKALRLSSGQIGTVRALEVTHGDANGWHPHIHEVWFCGAGVDVGRFKAALFPLWKAAAQRAGLGTPDSAHGLDVSLCESEEELSDYVSKWGPESELTRSHSKRGGTKGRTPFDLLRLYADGDQRAGALFAEFVKAFRGQRQLFWSRGLKAMFEIEEMTDEELAAAQVENAELVGEISPADWRLVLRRGDRFNVLVLARSGWFAVERYLATLRGDPLDGFQEL